MFSNEVKGGRSQGQSSKAWVDKRSFVDVIHNRKAHVLASTSGVNQVDKIVYFSTEKEELNRYRKAFTGIIKAPEVAMDLKQLFHEEGLFSIRVTLLGPNLCILEDLVCGEV